MGHYNYRYIARIVIEAETPLSIGCGDRVIKTDSPVIKDVNGLPYIPGSSLAGVIRHSLPDKIASDYMGYQDSKGGEGSKVIVSDAMLAGESGEIVEGLLLHSRMTPYLNRFNRLPIRQHVRISEKGVAEDKGKFDEEVVFKGARFCFEIETLTSDNRSEMIESLLDIICSPNFRIGGGTRNGFGLMKVISCRTRKYDLSDKQDLDAYIAKTSSLNDKSFDGKENSKVSESDLFVGYKLLLQADDFIFFSSGQGDADADNAQARESVVKWSDGKASFTEEFALVPATSVKGAIAHRTAYHYNKVHGIFAGSIGSKDKNPAVKELFGEVDGKEACAGKCFFSDVYVGGVSDKVLPHVAIDRFTGGAIAGALFQEKTGYAAGKEIILNVSVDKSVDEEYRKSLELALSDICKGYLPLGGSVNRGYGLFTGRLFRNGEEIKM